MFDENELDATDIRLRDGVLISVHAPGPSVVIVTAPTDVVSEACGLAKFRTGLLREGAAALHEGMPVDVVRAYCRGHGGVAEAGATALSLLKKLPAAAEPAPAPEVSAPAPEVASLPPFLLGEPRWPGGPRPRLTWGHWINSSWSQLRASGSTR